MAILPEATGEQGEVTLGQRVANIFLETWRNHLIGRERFFDFRFPEKLDTLRQSVGNVATEHLVEMICGEVVSEGEGVKEVAQELSIWQAEAARFHLHELALDAYYLSQSTKVDALIEGRLVTVKAQPNNSHVIQPAGEWAPANHAEPERISGYTQGADVKHGRLWLVEDALDSARLWVIKIIDYSPDNEPVLVADLEIEE